MKSPAKSLALNIGLPEADHAPCKRNMITYHLNLIFLIYQMEILLQIYTGMLIIKARHA